MPQETEYNSRVERLNRATRATSGLKISALGFLGMMLTAGAIAQINGAPVSATSPGFGGRQINGTAPSVTSLGPRGYTPNVPTCCFVGGFPRNPNSATNFHHHHHNGFIGGGYVAPYYGYYDYGSDADSQPDDQYTDQYAGGPTIFDRRGPRTASPPAPAQRSTREDTQPEPPSESQGEAAPAAEPSPTVLVFKDGHQLEVSNYAIVGSTLYDLTGGRRQKIALAELDLPATAKQNEDRGIDFEIPTVPEAD